MRILVIGQSGQLAKALSSEFSKTSWHVQSLSRRQLDLSQPKAVRGVLDGIAYDVLVNAAAYTAVDEAENDRDVAMAVNCHAVEELAKHASCRSVPFIHFSTDYVFDGTQSRPYVEVDACNPLGVYGESKRAGELAVEAVQGLNFVLRTSWVYGLTGNNFLKTMLRLFCRMEEVTVVDDQFGVPNHAGFLARMTRKLLETEAYEEAGGLYHLSAGGLASWHEFASSILYNVADLSCITVRNVVPISTKAYLAANPGSAKAPRPAYSKLDSSLFYKTFDIPEESWLTGLERCLVGIDSASVCKLVN